MKKWWDRWEVAALWVVVGIVATVSANHYFTMSRERAEYRKTAACLLEFHHRIPPPSDINCLEP